MKKLFSEHDISSVFFIIFYALLALITISLFSNYLSILVIALIIVQIFYPVYRRIEEKSKNIPLATTISVFLSLVAIFFPLIIILLLTINEIGNVVNSTDLLATFKNVETAINNTVLGFNSFLNGFGFENQVQPVQLTSELIRVSETLGSQLFELARQILSFSGVVLFHVFLLVISLIYLFPAYGNLPRVFSKISPLNDNLDKIFYEKFRNTIKGVVKGSLLVALVQATAVIIPMIVIGVGAPVLLWLIMVIFSIVPVGSGVVWAPVSLIFLIDGLSTGNPFKVVIAIALFVYSAVIINVIDTTLRPRLMKNTVNIHPLVTIFSVLGGIAAFGILGVFYGPLIVVIFLAFAEIYNKEYKDSKMARELAKEIEAKNKNELKS